MLRLFHKTKYEFLLWNVSHNAAHKLKYKMYRDVNEPLIRKIFAAARGYKPSLESELEKSDAAFLVKKLSNNKKNQPPDFRLLRQIICRYYPWTISKEFKRLFATKKQNGERIHRMLKIAERSCHLIVSILISQLYDEIKENRVRLSIAEKDKIAFKSNFCDGGGVSFANYAYLIRVINNIFKNHNINYFIPEMISLTKNDFTGALAKLREERNDFSHFTKEFQENECLAVEEALGTVITKLAFLVNYYLVTVNRITVQKPRHEKASFEHSIRLLHMSGGDEFVIDETIQDNFSDSNAVLLIKQYKRPLKYLNLSPFIIDTNDIIRTVENQVLLKDVYVLTGLNMPKSNNNSPERKIDLCYSGTSTNKKTSISAIKKYDNYSAIQKEITEIYKKLT